MRLRLIAIVIPVLLILSGCWCSDSILEKELVLDWKIQEDPQAKTVTISGFSGASAMVVEEVVQKKEGRDLVVEVHIRLARKGELGSLKAILDIHDIDRILFGTKREVVWQRNKDK